MKMKMELMLLNHQEKNIEKLQVKYLFKLALTKGRILHKSCREVLLVLLWDWILKKNILMFSNLQFFLYWFNLAQYLGIISIA